MSSEHSSPSHTPAAAQRTTGAHIEHVFESVVFASRWIQAPLYGGLIVAELLYAYKFLIELWEMVRHINQQEETIFMLGVLGLIDVTMVIIGGYATFVSKLDLEEHPDRPDWLTHIDPGTIKIKLAASLIGISSIHLLKSFVNIHNENYEDIKWKIFIHITFLGSAILLAWTDKIMQKDKKH